MENSEQLAPSEDSWYAQLLPLWRKVLKTDDVSIDDDFFEKGGDSLLAMDLHLELQRLTGHDLPESLLFESSTIRMLAKRLARPRGVRQPPVVRTA
jgi:acyl carrier protein